MIDLNNIYTKIYILLGSCLAWTAMFLCVNFTVNFSKLTKKENDDVKNRIVSAIHGLYTFGLIGYHFYRDQPQFETLNSPLQIIIILTSGGYVIYDTIACYYYGLFDIGLIIHHSMVLFGYWATQYWGYSTEGLTGLFYAEASNFPMHMRVILRIFKMRYTALFEFFEMSYICIYIVMRGFFATILFFETWSLAITPLAIKFSCSGIWMQSMFYVKEMFTILKRKISQYSERRKKNISYFWFSENPDLAMLSYYRKEARDKIFQKDKNQ